MNQPHSREKPWTIWHKRLHHELTTNPSLLPKGNSLLLAISGGQDSMALLGLLIDLRRLHNWKLHIWHGNHNWHQESTKISEGLKQWCDNRDLPFSSKKAGPHSTNNEAEARNWRYQNLFQEVQLLSSTNKEKPYRYVVTGHTATDRTETLLINLARGADLAGLSSMKKSRSLNSSPNPKVSLVRPMLCFSRNETAQICKELNLPIWLDPTNENKNFTRNRLRLEILPVLESLYPNCTLRIAALAERLSNYKNDKDHLTSLAIKQLSRPKGLCRNQLSELPLSLRTSLLTTWLQESGGPITTAQQIRDIGQRINKGNPPSSSHLARGWKLEWDRESIYLIRPMEEKLGDC